MKFKDLELTGDNHFIAMQYYGLILNRTYLVLLMDDRLVGIKVNGLVSIESGGNLLEKKLSNLMAVRGDLKTPIPILNHLTINGCRSWNLQMSISGLSTGQILLSTAPILKKLTMIPVRNGEWVIIRMMAKYT